MVTIQNLFSNEHKKASENPRRPDDKQSSSHKKNLVFQHFPGNDQFLNF